MRRLLELDAVRGLAALMVVLHHGLFLTGALDSALIGHVRSTPLQGLLSGRQFVLVFFVLSGFVLSRSLSGQMMSARAFGVWVAQRTIRLVLPALAAVAVSAALYWQCADLAWQPHATGWINQVTWSEVPTTADIVQQGLLLSSSKLDVVLWSLAVEWRWSFLIPPLVWLVAARPREGGVIALCVCAGLTGLAGGTWSFKIYQGESLLEAIQSTAYFALPFAAGIVLDRSGACGRLTDRWTTYAALFAAFGLARMPNDLGAVVGATVLIWAVQQATPVRSALRWAPLTWLGRVSFSLYLVHLPVLAAVFNALHDSYGVATLAAIGMVLSIPVAWLFHHAVERPSQLLARSLGRSRQRSAGDAMAAGVAAQGA